MTTASLVGGDRALAAATAALGTDGVAALLPYLQAAALSPSLRRTLKAVDIDVDDFRAQAAAVLGSEPPELAKLRRVSLRSGVSARASGPRVVRHPQRRHRCRLGTGPLVGSADASWWLIAFAFLVAQLPRVTQAVSTLGSVPVALPFGPVYGMQLATGYMNVALPSNLARMAVNIRFFQRQGLSPPTAVAAGAIDSFASTVLQAVLLGVLLIFSESVARARAALPLGRGADVAPDPGRSRARLRCSSSCSSRRIRRRRSPSRPGVGGPMSAPRSSRSAPRTSSRCSCSEAWPPSCSSRLRSASSHAALATTSRSPSCS